MRINKLFGGITMSWKRVILLSVLSGVIIGLLMLPDVLSNTSFQQPGISYEFWILFALVIALNCGRPIEAGVKTFIAFLISQPLIYLVQVPFCWLGWDIFNYYKLWFIITLFTFPGGMLAWYVKRGTTLSVLILSLANFILCIELPGFVLSAIEHFPRMLLASLFIIAELVVFIRLFDDKAKRRLAVVLIAVMLAGSVFYTLYIKNWADQRLSVSTEGTAPYELISNSERFDVELGDQFMYIEYRPADIDEPGSETIVYRDADGIAHEVELRFDNGGIQAIDQANEDAQPPETGGSFGE